MGSPYIQECPKCGETLSVLKHEYGIEVRCDKCHISEYGATFEKAMACFKAVDDDRTHLQNV